MRRFLLLAVVFAIAMSIGCVKKQADRIQQTMQPHEQLSHPLYYWETSKDKTILYEIMKDTSNISTVMPNVQGFMDLRCSKNATVYFSAGQRRLYGRYAA